MKTTVTINGVTKEIELTEEQSKLFKRHTGYERVEENENYYFLNSENKTQTTKESFDMNDTLRYVVGNYFSNEKTAEIEKQKTFLSRKITQYIQNKYVLPTSKDHYYICYRHNSGLGICITDVTIAGAIEVYSDEIGDDVINTFKKELFEILR